MKGLQTLRLLLAVLLVAALSFQYWQRRDLPAETQLAAIGRDPGLADVRALPDEAFPVLARIRSDAPHPYDRDGAVFGNFEGRLPAQPRGYYREYTVPTPGVSHRGARRIVAGGRPPREFWYTADHYESFVRLDPRIVASALDSAGASP
jgi:ribonuclease T1